MVKTTVCICAILALVGVGTATSAYAQINSWISPTRGYWDDYAKWSLDVAPTNSQTAYITNDISKTVTIDDFTSFVHPESMTVSNLYLSAPTGATNTLELMNAGSVTPLFIQDSLAIVNGCVLLMTNSMLQVGSSSNGSFVLEGTATISGTNSFAGGTYVGLSSNSVGSFTTVGGLTVITNGYDVIGFYGSGQSAVSGGTLQAGDDSSLPNGVFVGYASGSQGTLSIASGSFLTPEHLSFGQDAGSTGMIWVTGGQLIATNNYLTTVGGDGVGQLVVSNGTFAAASMIVATGPGSVGTLTVAGGAATLSGGLVVGDGLSATGIVSITGGQLAVTNQNAVVGSYGFGQLTMSNGVLLAQAWNVGNSTGSVGLLTIAGGITAVASNVIAGVFSNATGVIQIAGGNLTVTNQSGTGRLVVGHQGNGYLFQNGGVVTLDRLAISTGGSNFFYDGFPDWTNAITTAGVGQLILSNGLLSARTAEVGSGIKSQGTLTVAGGLISFTSNAVVGVMSNAVGVIQVANGNLFVTNQTGTAQLIVGQQGQGNFTQSGGASTVDQLFVINGTNSVFSLASGLFNSKSTTVSNAQTFIVGDGSGAAIYHLLGGVHSFADGLLIRTSSVLSGCGTIIGSVVVDPGGLILADCGGTLTFNDGVTNDGLIRAINGTTLESFGLVVNNGVIDAINGKTNFHSGFINNGVMLTSNSIPKFVSAAVSGADVQISFTTENRASYVFEERSDLASGSWTPVIGFKGTGGIMTFIDPNATTQQQRFYRIRLEVPE